MFKRLKLDFLVDEFHIGEKIVDYGIHFKDGKVQPKLVYHQVSGTCNELLHRCIPERFHKDFTVAIMEISAAVGPHTDSEITVTINHYFQTNFEETIFYELKKDLTDPKIKQIRNQTTGHVFRMQDLDIFGSFVAKENETWILDVSKIHSVFSAKPLPKLRQAIVLQTRVYTYDQVIEMLTEKGVV